MKPDTFYTKPIFVTAFQVTPENIEKITTHFGATVRQSSIDSLYLIDKGSEWGLNARLSDWIVGREGKKPVVFSNEEFWSEFETV
jgi:hypothetical protein